LLPAFVGRAVVGSLLDGRLLSLLVAFDSRTGNVARFIKKLDLPAVKITPELVIEEPFVLVTYTTGFGQVPVSTAEFLRNNHQRLMGVASSGNRNWGANFGKAADRIADFYHVRVVSKFELNGTLYDVERFHKEVESLVVANF